MAPADSAIEVVIGPPVLHDCRRDGAGRLNTAISMARLDSEG